MQDSAASESIFYFLLIISLKSFVYAPNIQLSIVLETNFIAFEENLYIQCITSPLLKYAHTTIEHKFLGQAQWLMPAIPPLGRMRQKDYPESGTHSRVSHDFQVNLSYNVRCCFKFFFLEIGALSDYERDQCMCEIMIWCSCICNSDG